MAEVFAWNPAQRFGLLHKGDIAPGYDADLALVHPRGASRCAPPTPRPVRAYTLFEGQELH